MEPFISSFRLDNNLKLVHNFIILRLRANKNCRSMAILEVVSTSVVANPVFQSSSSSSD